MTSELAKELFKDRLGELHARITRNTDLLERNLMPSGDTTNDLGLVVEALKVQRAYDAWLAAYYRELQDLHRERKAD
jgi:hypothetical protein